MGPHAKDKLHVGFYLTRNLVDDLDTLAKEERRTRSSYLLGLVERHVIAAKRLRSRSRKTGAAVAGASGRA